MKKAKQITEPKLDRLLRIETEVTKKTAEIREKDLSESLIKEKVLDMARQMSRKEIVTELEIPIHVVSKHLKYISTEHDKNTQKLKTDRYIEIYNLRKEGETFDEIGRKIGTNPNTTRNLYYKAKRLIVRGLLTADPNTRT